MIITLISFAYGPEQQKALLLAFIVCFVVDISLSRTVFIVSQAMIGVFFCLKREQFSTLNETELLCARNCLFVFK